MAYIQAMRPYCVLFPIAIFLLCVSCSERTSVEESVEQAVFAVIDAGDRRDKMAIRAALSDTLDIVVSKALDAAASMCDTELAPALDSLVCASDNSTHRMLAIYALGQCRDSSVSHYLFDCLERSTDAEHDMAAAALGKTIKAEQVSRFLNSAHDGAGKAEGLYGLAVRQLLDSVGIRSCIDHLEQKSTQSRFFAAQALSRQRDADILPFSDYFRSRFGFETDPEIINPMLRVLSKSSPQWKEEIVLPYLADENSPGQTVNAIRSLRTEDMAWALPSLERLLVGESYQVVKSAFQKIKSSAIKPSVEPDSVRFFDVRCLLMSHNGRSNEELLNLWNVYEEVYERAAILSSLMPDSEQIQFLDSIMRTPSEGVLRGFAHSKLVEWENVQAEQLEVRGSIDEYALKSGDVALICQAAAHLRSRDFDKQNPVIESWLNEALERLDLPEQSEAEVEIQRTLAFIRDEEFIQPKPQFNHAIDFDYLKKIGGNPRMVIETNRGIISIELDAISAPGSVLAIVQLAEDGYYDGKTFHRVVPDFVVQGGCPRGDGWGGMDFSLRSELPRLRYKRGTVGLASAGNDTEGCQFFITHSPTPHLEGRYTVVGKVTNGMEIVDQIVVGDVMNRVTIECSEVPLISKDEYSNEEGRY